MKSSVFFLPPLRCVEGAEMCEQLQHRCNNTSNTCARPRCVIFVQVQRAFRVEQRTLPACASPGESRPAP